MAETSRDRIFLSYSREDEDIFKEVKDKLLSRGLEASLWDDSQIEAGVRWDDAIQAAMDATAVAVLILSDHFFRRREGGGDYILERELPYFLEHRRLGDLDILPLYWRASNHYAPDVRDAPGLVQPFAYEWQGQAHTFELQDIQASNRGAQLSPADEHKRLGPVLRLALAVEERLAKRLAHQESPPNLLDAGGRHALTIDLDLAGRTLHRTFKVCGQAVPMHIPSVPQALIAKLKATTGPVSSGDQASLGADLYQILFGPEDQNSFAQLARTVWDLAPGCQANGLACAVEIRCDAMGNDPWPLTLPWNLTAFRGEHLAEHCTWSFETAPPGVDTRRPQALSPDPPLLLLYDEAAEGAHRHVDGLRQYLDRAYGFAADVTPCAALAQLAERLGRAPEPEVLYVYAPVDLDLTRLAAALGQAVPLVVLNLIGERPPWLPAELVRERKVVLALHPAAQADQARDAGDRWLQAFLEGAGRTSWQDAVLKAFKPGVRLWSGCAGIETRVAQTRGDLFRRGLIKLLLDRVTARGEVSDQVATALNNGFATLGLIAAGTHADHPRLLPPQVWHHYQYVHGAGSRDTIHRLDLPAGPEPAADEIHYRLANYLRVGTHAWQDALDRLVGEPQAGERAILSLEWQVPACPKDRIPEDWRRDWLEAWLSLGTETLAGYSQPGVLIVHTLLVETSKADEAKRWCDQARDLYRARRRGLSETGKRFVYHHLAPLSEVPVEDIERFLDVHYKLQNHYPELDPYAVALWIRAQTGGNFAETVRRVEDLHDTGFRAAYVALEDGNI